MRLSASNVINKRTYLLRAKKDTAFAACIFLCPHRCAVRRNDGDNKEVQVMISTTALFYGNRAYVSPFIEAPSSGRNNPRYNRTRYD